MTTPAHSTRSFIAISGPDRVVFLQGILTQDVIKLQDEKIQFAALLSPQGKILHDMFLIALDDAILIDTQAQYAETLLKRLAMYKLRAKVTIEKTTPPDISLPDPRHPELPLRNYLSPVTCHLSPLPLGIPELGRDFEPDQIVPLDAGYDLLNAVSFTKGCYVGQEVTARMHYKNIARRGFFILEQDGNPVRLMLLKFEEVEAAKGIITVDNATYHARLPGWMQPKLAQFHAGVKNQ